VLRQPAGQARMMAYHSSEARLRERNFTGNNNGRYMNPELDQLVDRFTIPRAERMRLMAQIVDHVTDQLPVLPLFFDATPSLVHNRVRNVTPVERTRGRAPGVERPRMGRGVTSRGPVRALASTTSSTVTSGP
jgi:ABC-type transport system substrate-binding protein